MDTMVAPEPNRKQTIVIVEDNNALAEIYKTRLELLDYTCFVAENGIVGLYFIQKEQPDLVLLDMMVPDIPGDQILAKMRSSTWGKDIPVFVISNLNEADVPTNLRELGISGYAVKANMTDDEVDRIVNGILRPTVQPEPSSQASVETPLAAQDPAPIVVEQEVYMPPAEAPPSEQSA